MDCPLKLRVSTAYFDVPHDVYRLCAPPSEGVQGNAVLKGKRPNPWAERVTPSAPIPSPRKQPRRRLNHQSPLMRSKSAC